MNARKEKQQIFKDLERELAEEKEKERKKINISKYIFQKKL